MTIKNENKDILAIIPARGGSKRIPNKNIKEFNGKPLIVYSILVAKSSKFINHVVVSTEDSKIKEISEKHRIQVISRPLELALDETPTVDVVLHALNVLDEKEITPEIVVLLQPTSPLRTTEDVDAAIELFLESECESLVSVHKVKHPPYWSFKIVNGYLKPLFGDEYFKNRSQDFDMIYQPNGAIFIAKRVVIQKYNSFYCKKTIPFEMPAEKSIDIDEEIDFQIAELIMKKNSKQY